MLQKKMIIGMLPSPGGARLSCPMVEETTAHSQLQTDKAYTNYWYRHIWMDGFILYPPMLMAARILEKSVLELFSALLPVMAVWFVIGVVVGLRRFEKKGADDNDPERSKAGLQIGAGFKTFLSGVYPIIAMITLYILMLQLGIGIALHIAGALVISLLLLLNKCNRTQVKANLKDAFKPKFAVIILGAITFSEFFKGAGFIDEMILRIILIFLCPGSWVE